MLKWFMRPPCAAASMHTSAGMCYFTGNMGNASA